MSKLLCPVALTLSLALVACQPTLNQTPASTAARSVQTTQTVKTQKVQPVGHARSIGQQQQAVHLTYPQVLQGFSTQSFDCGTAAFVSLEAMSSGLSTPIYADGADEQQMTPITGCDISGTLSGVPYGYGVITAKLYDADRHFLAGSELVSGGYFTANSTMELSYRQTNVGQALQQLYSGTIEDNFLAQQLDVKALQGFFDTVSDVSGNYPNYAFTTAPSLVKVSAVVADLKANGGDIAALDPESSNYKATAGSLSLQVNGLANDKTALASTDDAISDALSLNNNGSFTLNNVPPGTWTLRVGSDNYESQRIPITLTEGQTLPITLNLVYKTRVIYVNDDAPSNGNNDGSSWTHAYRSLQDALSEATDTDEIWMAEGTYTPVPSDASYNADSTERDVSFQLKENVNIYGGFQGTETTRAERSADLSDFVTVLSGDLTGNDNTTTPGSTRDENSKTVVTGANNTTLEGVTVQGGNASGADGGGMYNNSSSPTLMNVTFANNSANNGGGMYNNSSSPTLTNVTFANNSAVTRGGGMYNYVRISIPTLTNVTFLNNTANDGGGMYNLGASPTLMNVTFANNSANNGDGGGMHNSGSTSTLKNVTFANNSAVTRGGGIHNRKSSPTLTNVLFWNSSLSGQTISSAEGNFALTGTAGETDDPFVGSANPNGDDGIPRTADDGLRIKASATAIINLGVPVTGTPDPALDILGLSRVDRPEPGAYEYIP